MVLMSNSKFQHIPEAHMFRSKFEFGIYDYLLAAYAIEHMHGTTWEKDMKDLFSRLGETMHMLFTAECDYLN